MTSRLFGFAHAVPGLAVAVALTAHAGGAQRTNAGLAIREFFAPELAISSENRPLDEVLDRLPNRDAWRRFQRTRAAAGLVPAPAFIDPRSGTATNIIAAAPLVPGDGSGNGVTWAALSAAAKYWVFRSDGPKGCLSGKTRIAELPGTTFTYTDPDVLPGRTYFYNVMAVGSSPACLSLASRCVAVAADP